MGFRQQQRLVLFQATASTSSDFSPAIVPAILRSAALCRRPRPIHSGASGLRRRRITDVPAYARFLTAIMSGPSRGSVTQGLVPSHECFYNTKRYSSVLQVRQLAIATMVGVTHLSYTKSAFLEDDPPMQTYGDMVVWEQGLLRSPLNYDPQLCWRPCMGGLMFFLPRQLGGMSGRVFAKSTVLHPQPSTCPHSKVHDPSMATPWLQVGAQSHLSSESQGSFENGRVYESLLRSYEPPHACTCLCMVSMRRRPPCFVRPEDSCCVFLWHPTDEIRPS
ncbi:hypothetical protein GY45DRAFT_19174 [Cubamyces sp. BRFM 1775]|nr:hypothetical protein GY45DRAFT_19174 [Cubamyces sp. BRFM 1775]